MADIGLAWVNPAPFAKPENVVNFAKKCEAMGCHSMWTVDYIAYDDNLEPLTILAAAAGATQRLRLGTSVLLGNLRHPSHLAKIYINWLLSKERQTVFAGANGYVSARLDVPTDHTEPWRVPLPGAIKTYTKTAMQVKDNLQPLLQEVFGSP
jgi:Luciferase-like monooxygenase